MWGVFSVEYFEWPIIALYWHNNINHHSMTLIKLFAWRSDVYCEKWNGEFLFIFEHLRAHYNYSYNWSSSQTEANKSSNKSIDGLLLTIDNGCIGFLLLIILRQYHYRILSNTGLSDFPRGVEYCAYVKVSTMF